MRNEITQTDSEIEAAFQAAFQIGVDIDDLVFTRDTLENFDEASSKYASCGVAKFGKTGELRTLFMANAQPRKGDQRRDVHVIDFGAVRACYR